MTKFTVSTDDIFAARVHKQDFKVDVTKLPQIALDKIFAYGLQQIFNDAAASAKTDKEAIALASKRYDSLVAGIVRASPIREGDPVKARALELALPRVKAAPGFIAWLAKNNLKASDKAALAQLRKSALDVISVEGNKFVAQAEKDVKAAKAIEVELDLDFGDNDVTEDEDESDIQP